MDKTDPPVFTGCRPVLPVADLKASLTYYRERLGFELGWAWPDPDTGEPPSLVYVFRGHFELFLRAQTPPVHPIEIAVGMPSQVVVDRLAQEYKDSGAKLVEAPSPRPWGTYEMLVCDLDDHRLRMLTDRETRG